MFLKRHSSSILVQQDDRMSLGLSVQEKTMELNSGYLVLMMLFLH